MSSSSTIEWTEATWNPVTGCSKVSPGCAHCYAETLTARYAGSKGWIEEHRPWTPENAEHNVRLRLERLEQPLRWSRPRMIFVNSMSDMFHELIPDEFIAQVFAVMAAAPQHTFQVLTKRPERMREWLTAVPEEDVGWLVGTSAKQQIERALETLWEDHPTLTERQVENVPEFVELPLPNVWLGTSIENRRHVDRAVSLGDTPAAVRFISAEPLLGPLIPEMIEVEGDTGATTYTWKDDYYGPGLRFYNLDGDLAFNWLIAGGESGPDHRPMDPEWVRYLRDVCVHEQVAFFFKQWGGRTPKAGGRELDGRTWDQMPERAELAA